VNIFGAVLNVPLEKIEELYILIYFKVPNYIPEVPCFKTPKMVSIKTAFCKEVILYYFHITGTKLTFRLRDIINQLPHFASMSSNYLVKLLKNLIAKSGKRCI